MGPGSGRPPKSDALGLEAGDRRCLLGQALQRLVVEPVGGCHADALALDEAQVQDRVRLGHVLVDLAVGEAGERLVRAHDHGFGLGRTGRQRQLDGALGQRQAVDRLRFDHHLPTPTWTSRKRAPLTACPTCATCPGSPLPQLGVPSIR